MLRTKWTERKFTFDFPEGWLPDILERLSGTLPRIQCITKDLGDAQLSYAPAGKWSIKQHIGHLCDLEDLHEGRIDDLIQRKEILRAADMSNQKTWEAAHNQQKIEILFSEFMEKRNRFISRLKLLDDATQLFASQHPRLQTKMRAVDVAYFTAEHDDHHLADIRELLEG